MNVLESLLILAATVSALWWAFARHRAPVALERLSLAGLALAVLAMALEGVHWQLVPWQLLALACAAVALLRRQRLARSRRIVRVVGRAALVLGIFAGGLGLLAARVPQLPRPSGPHLVGSVVFHWTDAQRPETFASSAGERRQVVAQAWYPTETPGPPVPYFEAQGRLPAYVDPYPAFFYGDFDQVDTHASASPPRRRCWRRTPASWSASTSTARSQRRSRAAGTWVRPSCGCRVMVSSRRAICTCATGSSRGSPAASCWSWAAPATRASPTSS